MDPTEFSALLGLGGNFAIVGLTEIVKRAAALPERYEKRFVPLLALLLGIGWNALALSAVQAADTRLVLVVLLGIQSGLSSMGLWSSGKSVIESRTPTPRG